MMPEIHSAVTKIADTICYGSGLSELEQYNILIVQKEYYSFKKQLENSEILNENLFLKLDLLEQQNQNDPIIAEAYEKIEEWEERTNIKELIYDITIDLVKYGDAFLEKSKKGDEYYYLPSNEIIWELDKTGKPIKYWQVKMEDKKELNPKNIIHFSTAVVPPGETMLYPLIRNWRYLKILEDAIIINRITRATMKLIFKIDVTGKSSTKAKLYLMKFAEKLKQKTQINIKEGMIQGDYSGLRDFLDIILPVTKDSATDVQSISGDSSLQRVDDVQLMQRRLLAALDIPKAYLNFEEATRNRSIIDRIETNFARTIRKYQRKLILGLKKIYKDVLSDIDWNKYKLIIEFPSPSIVDEQIKSEVQQRKTLVINNLYNVLPTTLPIEFIINYVFKELSLAEKYKLIKALTDKLNKNNKPNVKVKKTLKRQNINRDREPKIGR